MKMSRHIIFYLNIALLFFPAICFSTSTAVKVIQDYNLMAYYNGEYKEIIKESGGYYGYGLLDNDRIFVAMQPHGITAATAIVKTIDLKHQIEKRLFTIDAAGETSFDINSTTKNIVFNDLDGIKTLIIFKDNTYKIRTVFKRGVDPAVAFAPFWIDEYTIGFMYVKTYKPEFIKLDIRTINK